MGKWLLTAVVEVKNNRKIQITSVKSGHGRLQEVVTYKTVGLECSDRMNLAILKKWSLRRGVPLTRGGRTRRKNVTAKYNVNQ